MFFADDDLLCSSRVHYPYQEDYNGRFEPVKGIALSDGDIVLKIIRLNGLLFSDEVNDPLFSAHKERTRLSWGAGNVTYHIADFPISVVGCVEQVSETS